MPELPDLEAVKGVLNRRISGRRISAVAVLRPIALRNLTPLTPDGFLVGQTVKCVARRGKFLLWELDNSRWVAMNFMLAGHLRWADPVERALARDYVAITFEEGTHLRYHDPEGMGKLYLTERLDAIPGLASLGPDADDPALTAETFLERLGHHHGEIKGVLTRGAVVAGIGNAYADEILFAAGVYPFRKRTTLTRQEQVALFQAMRTVLAEATAAVSERMGDDIHLKIRDMLRVHRRKGEPCPRCGQAISEVNVRGSATNFCRRCQPGSLLDR